jgi:hypothetical protein
MTIQHNFFQNVVGGSTPQCTAGGVVEVENDIIVTPNQTPKEVKMDGAGNVRRHVSHTTVP